jgi:hypothetical protein
MKGQPTRCSLKILPGKSPFRIALEQNREIDIGMKYSQSVDLKIQYDVYKPMIEPKIKLPEKIHCQLTKLSENISTESRIKFDDEFILISTPLALGENVVTVAYKKVIPYQIAGVFLAPENKDNHPVDLTSTLLSHDYNCDLLKIYQAAREVVVNRSEINGDSIAEQKFIHPHSENPNPSERVYKDNSADAGDTDNNTNTNEEGDCGV